MKSSVFKFEGDHFLKTYEIKEVNGRFFIYKGCGTYQADAKSLGKAVKALDKILYHNGVTKKLGEVISSYNKGADNDSEKTETKSEILNFSPSKRSAGWLKKLEGTIIFEDAKKLIEGETVEVGYRSTCGSTDDTLKTYRIFMGLVKAIKSQGFEIEQDSVKHKNAYATNNGGFWNSYKFKIIAKIN